MIAAEMVEKGTRGLVASHTSILELLSDSSCKNFLL